MIQATAYILIGGKSERFGSPKWQAQINSRSVLDIIWDTCCIFQSRFILGKEKPENFEKPFISDALEIQAPINGLYTALKYTKTDWILLLSCDMPLINANVFEALWEARTKENDAVIPVANNHHQGTCAFYHKRILPPLESGIQHNYYSLYSFVKKLKSIKVEFGYDKRFWNMNTKKDYEEISTNMSIPKRY